MAIGTGTNHKTWFIKTSFIKQVLIKPCFVGVNGVLIVACDVQEMFF